ncbi:MAG TPA: metal ABC transporter permease [Kineosporiaceae bacterium]|nr:metal ABC transporter permease [Kineosporiaceae bacterium]
MSILSYDFMQRALAAAVLVGLAAPTVGVFLVQRRLALMGDGIGHVALTGVALGFLLGVAPLITAVLAATAGAVTIELIRARGRTGGDVALALLFYGGIAGGVLLIGLSPGGTSATLLSYLFGSLTSVSAGDLIVIAVLAGMALLLLAGFGRELFTVCHDEEYARASGLRVRVLTLLLAAAAAVTVTVAMRVVGLLLVSALMVVPVATAQQLTRSFLGTLVASLVLGVAVSVAGVVLAFQADVAPGASIVVLALGVFALAVLARFVVRHRRPRDTFGAEDVPQAQPAVAISSTAPPAATTPPAAVTARGDR